MELDLFAACLPGLEPLLVDELRALGTAPKERPGGVSFRGSHELLLRAHLELGTASHLLLRCGSFLCRNLNELTSKTAQLPWPQWLRPDQPVTVSATSRKSRLYHTGAIEERVQKGIAMALGVPVPTGAIALDPGRPTPTIAVRFVDDTVTLSLDTSITPLHRRGYRLESAKAPLREDLAHALLRAAGYARGTALLDPFCGAGTIAIEAAAIAHGLPPGRLRPPPLQGTALANDASWQTLLEALPRPPFASTREARISASDRDAGAIGAAQGNAERAGLADAITLHACAITAAPWFDPIGLVPKPVLVATNPPFGHRIGAGKDLGNLYQTLGHRTQRLGAGARAALLAHDPRLARRTGLPLKVAFATRHGGLQVTAMIG